MAGAGIKLATDYNVRCSRQMAKVPWLGNGMISNQINSDLFQTVQPTVAFGINNFYMSIFRTIITSNFSTY